MPFDDCSLPFTLDFLLLEMKNKTSASKRNVLSKKNLTRPDSLGEDDGDDDDLNKVLEKW